MVMHAKGLGCYNSGCGGARVGAEQAQLGRVHATMHSGRVLGANRLGKVQYGTHVQLMSLAAEPLAFARGR